MNAAERRVQITSDGTVRILFNESWKDISIPNYKNFKVISGGANAVTVSGIHEITSRKDCIKIYTSKSGREKVTFDQYKAEVSKLASLNDPHIVTVYDAFDVEDIHVVIMEYIDGVTLKEWLKRKTGVGEEQQYIDRLEIVRTILETILRYQQQGVIHGDLHLNNILVNNTGNIFLIDFGRSNFSNNNKSDKRESYFVYDLVRQVLGKKFDKNYFSLECPDDLYDKFSCVRNIPKDVRNKYPILVTRTMLAYVNAMDSLLQFSYPTETKDIVDFCRELKNGIYINYDYVFQNLCKATENNFPKRKIIKTILSSLQSNLIPDYIEFDEFERENLRKDLFDIYFDLSIKTKDKWNVNKSKAYTLSKVNYIKDSEYNVLMERILGATQSNYYEFIGAHCYFSDTDNKIISIMRDALYVYYGVLFFEQKIWVKLNERRWERREKDFKKLMTANKNKINYTVVCVNEFARRFNLGQKVAFDYLFKHKGIEFLKEHYDIEHTLSIDDAVDDLITICRKNGGTY